MSMISAQCDELRKTADELQGFMDNAHNYTWSGLFSTLHYAQQRLRGAADTIWELRCKLSGVVDQQDEIERLRDENDRLRELCGETCDLLPHADWPSAECDDRASACIDKAIELGIEAD